MRKLPKRNTQNAKITDPRAKMKVLEKDRERKQKVLQQMIQILRVKKRKVQRRKSTRRKRNTKSIRRTRNIRSTRRGKMTAAARMPVMMKKKKSLKENSEKRH